MGAGGVTGGVGVTGGGAGVGITGGGVGDTGGAGGVAAGVLLEPPPQALSTATIINVKVIFNKSLASFIIF